MSEPGRLFNQNARCTKGSDDTYLGTYNNRVRQWEGRGRRSWCSTARKKFCEATSNKICRNMNKVGADHSH